jgi:hypothetical protein
LALSKITSPKNFSAKKLPTNNNPEEQPERSIFRLQGFFRAKYSAKNSPSVDSSGQKIIQRRIFRPNEKLMVALRRRIIRAKNFPAKNFPPLRKISVALWRRIIRRRIFRLQGFFSSEKLSGEDYS